MKIDFRQGIVSYPESTGGQAFLQVTGGGAAVNILTGTGFTTIAFAHRTADYLITETSPVSAWSGITPGTESWLYWDIDPQTAVVTYGFTVVQPTSGLTQPTTLVADKHWFDTANNVMKVYNGSSFIEKIRVFAARINGTTLYPMGTTAAKPFAGTQVGVNQSTFAGPILFTQGLPVVISVLGTIFPLGVVTSGSPITIIANPFARNFTFATTETEFLVGGSQKISNIRLESDVVTASASIGMAAYDVVQYSAFGVISPADYNDTSTTVVGMITDDVSVGEVVTVILQGTITNEAWNWTTIGAELFISTEGGLTASDPNLTNPTLYPASKPPVARVVSQKEIIFMQGLGKVGPRGLNPLSINTVGDVTIFNPLANQLLKYSGSPQLWRNGFVSLNEIFDIELTNVSAAQALVFSGSPQMWRNSAVLSASSLGSPIADEDFLQFDTTASNWTNVTRRSGNVGYFGVTPVERGTGAFVSTDAGKGVFSSTLGSPIGGTSVTWTLNAGVFSSGDVITLVRRFNADGVTIASGSHVRIESQVDGTKSDGSPVPVLTLDNPAQVTLWLVSPIGSPIGSPGTDTWLVAGSGFTFT